MSRADKNTVLRKKIVIYSDFLTNFNQNPHTGYLAVVNNENAVKQSYRNLVLTGRGERFYDSEKAGDIRDALFELTTSDFSEAIVLRLKSTLNRYEPRGEILDIEFVNTDDENLIDMKLIFSTMNDQDQIYSLNLHIKRVR